MQDYLDFLASKRKKLDNAGFQVSPDRISSHLFPNQSHIVRQALRKARYAIFSAPGTGKTLMQLEWASHVSSHTGRQAIRMDRRAIGFELKHSYFEAAKRNLQAAEQGKSQLSMLNLIEEPA